MEITSIYSQSTLKLNKGGESMSSFNNLDDLFKHLNNKVKSVSGTYTLDVLLTDEYLQEKTKFSSFEEFENACPVPLTDESLETEKVALDDFIKANTSFDNFDDFSQDASKEYLERKLAESL